MSEFTKLSSEEIRKLLLCNVETEGEGIIGKDACQQGVLRVGRRLLPELEEVVVALERMGTKIHGRCFGQHPSWT